MDILLSQWAEQLLPKISVEAGWETLQQEFRKLIQRNKLQKDHDDIFDDLKTAVLDEVLRRHKWEEKVNDLMKYIPFAVLKIEIDFVDNDDDVLIMYVKNLLRLRTYYVYCK